MVSVKMLLEFVLLLVMSIQDYRTQEIHMGFLFLFTGMGFIFCIWQQNEMQIMIRILCGLWILGIGFLVWKITKGGIGLGDVWLISCMALWETGTRLWEICVLAIMLSGIHSILMYLWKQTSKTIAFVPWVGISTVVLNVI